MLNYSFIYKNESKPDNVGNMNNSSNFETIVVIMLWYWPLYSELLRFVQYHLQFFYAVLLLEIFLLGLLFNLFTLPMNFDIQLVGLFIKSKTLYLFHFVVFLY